ncbi:hypothetical protein AGOR_G00184440 [Albula goreensis]|uniref:Ubiquitin-like domain-containing protein n=1 Tax=Albula goreensis TaxID=1534307 RepID=A0A8T3CYG2_9TELE|nr:hypothetical protein AGOR_G00184440 [Albula goreensis]
MGQILSYFVPTGTPNHPKDELNGIDSEQKSSQNGSSDQQCLAQPAAISEDTQERERNKTGSEGESGTSPGSETQEVNDSLKDVDRINILVKCQGKTVEIDAFPLEKMSKLLQEVCQELGKNPNNMKLIYKGEVMNETKTVRDYRLRGGTTLQLIRSA